MALCCTISKRSTLFYVSYCQHNRKMLISVPSFLTISHNLKISATFPFLVQHLLSQFKEIKKPLLKLLSGHQEKKLVSNPFSWPVQVTCVVLNCTLKWSKILMRYFYLNASNCSFTSCRSMGSTKICRMKASQTFVCLGDTDDVPAL